MMSSARRWRRRRGTARGWRRRAPRKIQRTCEGCKLDFKQCVCKKAKKKENPAADEACERALLRELYAALVAPVDEHLTGAEEVPIVPHKELLEVPWAALIDAHGHFLIERHVLRVAPSLRVAHQAAQRPGQHRRATLDRLDFLHCRLPSRRPPPWRSQERKRPRPCAAGSLDARGAGQRRGCRQAGGSAAGRGGRGEIKAEGVVGLARGFLLAGAAAAVVSLWSVDDGSTAELMEYMYQHLVKGCTVPEALRLAMLRLARRPALDQPVSEHDVADGLQEAWKRPMHWAGFLVMGTSTRLPRRRQSRQRRGAQS